MLSAGRKPIVAREHGDSVSPPDPGDLFVLGRRLQNHRFAAASFLFCPTKVIQTLPPSGEVRLDTRLPKVKSGKLSEQPVRACALPETLRVAVASQQHYGVTMTRGVSKLGTPPIPMNQLPADVMAELGLWAPNDVLLQAVAAASVFEKHQLIANALAIYYKLREQWPDAVWVKSRIFDLEETLAVQNAAAVAAGPGDRPMRCWSESRSTSDPNSPCSSPRPTRASSASCSKVPRGGGIPPKMSRSSPTKKPPPRPSATDSRIS